MTVGELLNRINSRELTEWMIFDKHEPIGDARMDVLFALSDSILANVNRNPAVRKEPFSISDFIPDWWAVPKSPKEEALGRMKANLMMAEVITAAFGGQDLRKP
jgi:hypothetical protein